MTDASMISFSSSAAEDREAMHISIASVVANELVTAVFQPVIDLETGDVSGYEAFARGPKGTVLERPGDLFAAADRAGVRSQLEWVCRAAALRCAVEAGLDRSTCLYLNIEPTPSSSSDIPAHLATEIAAAASQLHVVAELSESDVTADPGSLMRTVSGMRGLGFEIGIDDLGANNNALSLFPFLQPDVIKIDVGLLSVASSEMVAATAAAVRADVDRRGSIVVAERVETEEQLDLAVVMGADHAQGWLFTPPGPLADVRIEAPPARQRRRRPPPLSAPSSPFALVENSDDLRVGTKRQLVAMSRAIEDLPLSRFDRPVLLASFQHEGNFDTATQHRYDALADHHAFIGVVGRRIDARPGPRLRGGGVPSGHPVGRDWVVTRLGPHFSAALIAQEINCGAISERDRRFAYVMTHDRDMVTAAATSLLQLIEPLD